LGKKKILDSVVVSRERKEKGKKGRMKKKMAGSSFVTPMAGLDLAGHRDPQLGLANQGSVET
jgi:hypothetical protein